MTEKTNYDLELAVMKLARLTKRHGAHLPMHPHIHPEGGCRHHGDMPMPPRGCDHGPHHGMRALSVIAENNNPSSRELAEFLDIRPSSLTELLDRLEREELVVRTPDENDKRVSRVSLTEKGKEAEAKIRAHREARIAEMSSCFTEEEKVQFCALCDKLAEHWNKLSKEREEMHMERCKNGHHGHRHGKCGCRNSNAPEE